MKILITGGLGFIGHNVVKQLLEQGHEVQAVDNCTDYGIIPRAELEYIHQERRNKISGVRVRELDIESKAMGLIFKEFVPDVVVHLASFPRQKVVNANPQFGSRVMSEGLLNLLELAVSNNVKKFVYISSSMVYGDFNDLVTEDAPCNPIGQYGILKLAGEWLVKDYARRTKLNTVIIRPSAVYGPCDVEDRVVSKFLLTAMRGGSIQVNGANEGLDFTYVEDIARGIALASTSDIADNNTYNITRGRSRTLLEAAELAVKIVGRGSIQVNDRDLNFPSRGALNINAASSFGYTPKTDIEEGFREYYNWLTNSVYWSKKTV